jgi:hypothetical protein
VLDLMLPYPECGPAMAPKSGECTTVATAIGLNLRSPGLRKCVRPCWIPPTMPKVPVDEDDKPDFAEDKVWSTREIPSMPMKPEPTCGK